MKNLTLSNGNTFELTNGVDGEDGSVVEIRPNGNWFIDGVDTQKPSRGEKGDKGDPGEKGEQGEPGEPGTPGQSTSSVYYYPGMEYAYIPYHPVTFDSSEKTGMMTVHQVVTGEGYAELAQPYTIKDEIACQKPLPVTIRTCVLSTPM